MIEMMDSRTFFDLLDSASEDLGIKFSRRKKYECTVKEL